jgi:hypothetical protein
MFIRLNIGSEMYHLEPADPYWLVLVVLSILRI